MPGHEEAFASYIGKIVVSHETNYLCVALENDALLLLQLLDNGTPLQFIVAHHPDLYNEELVWSNGDYFPFFAYHSSDAPIAQALRDSGLAMGGGKVYAAMVDDELGARCAGIFTQYNTACHVLECLIAKDETVRDLIGQSGNNNRLTLSEYKRLFDQYSLENAYWIEEKTMNQVSMS
nr:MAG TPA: hypothetical protein [Bacteriophage sp.]